MVRQLVSLIVVEQTKKLRRVTIKVFERTRICSVCNRRVNEYYFNGDSYFSISLHVKSLQHISICKIADRRRPY